MSNAAFVSFVSFAAFAVVFISSPTCAGPLGSSDHSQDALSQQLSLSSSATHSRGRSKREIYPEVDVEVDEVNPVGESDKDAERQPQVCVVGDVVYMANESVPAEQPCLNCKCQPPGVHCETIRCAKKPGCRALHKPNTCCPDYQCECLHEGRTYPNGERLDQKPGSECRVCYCRGGELQCADVSCYTRNDCEGRIVPGKCCRKYDHCPPKAPSSIVHGNEILDGNHTKLEGTFVEDSDDDHPQITIHEIIPEIKEIPITNAPKRSDVKGGMNSSEDSTKDSENSVETVPPEEDIHDAESESSEITEVYQQPPPVLRVGDKLLYVQKDGQVVSEHEQQDASTPASIITIIGAEGLQRGFEESIEKEGNERGNTDQGEENDLAESTYILSLVTKPTTSTIAISNENVTESLFSDGDDLLFPIEDVTNFTDIERVVLENSTEILSTMDDYNMTSISSSGEIATSNIDSISMSFDNATETEITSIAPTLNVSTMHSAVSEKDEIETNPEYPPIPDVMIQPLEEGDATHHFEKLPSHSEMPLSSPDEDATSDQSAPTSAINLRSIESMEIESVETSDHASVFNETDNVGLENMNEPSSPSASPSDNSSIELVEMIPGFTLSSEIQTFTSSSTPTPLDVETIDLDEEAKNSTHESKNKRKRNSDEDESIFQELSREIGLESGTLHEDEGSKEDQEKEARKIFQELLDEATSNTSPKPISLVGSKPETPAQHAQAQALGRIGDALSKFRLRDTKNIFDGNALSIVRDLFTAQYRAYN